MSLRMGNDNCISCGSILAGGRPEDVLCDKCVAKVAYTPRSDKVMSRAAAGNIGLLVDAFDSAYPDNNPKAAVASSKCPVHLVPPALVIGVAEAMKNGADKYGAYNFRDSKISASVYYSAMLRHLYAWWDGEDNASDSGLDHLKHIGSSIALLLDAQASGTFDDDRPRKSGSANLLEEYYEKSRTINK
tara:strand:+ start:8157 stop:8720 length:564 start_codon:yes stop_codon:yes gene_type:complete